MTSGQNQINPKVEIRRLEVRLEVIEKRMNELSDLTAEREKIRQKILGLRLFLGEPTREADPDRRSSRRSKGKVIRDAVARILKDHPQGLYYKELLTALANEGIHVSGERPGYNLIAHLSLDSRFQNVGRGTWMVMQQTVDGHAAGDSKPGNSEQ